MFRRVWVDNLMTDGALIFWDLSAVPPGGVPEYTAEWGRTINGPWTPVDSPPVFDTYFLLDMGQHLHAKELDLYYRVRLDTGLHTLVSEPVRADGGMPKRDWLNARAIVRKEYLNMVKGPGGIRGCLLKRRNWGERCRTCTDHDTGAPSQGKCLECFNTGIVGGYYPPVDYWILPTPAPKKTTRNTNSGMATMEDLQARCVAYPMLSPGDVWCSNETGRRYLLGDGSKTIQILTQIRNKPLILQAVLGLAPASHIVYDVPLEACSQGKSYSGPEPDPCEPEPVDSQPDVDDPVESDGPICGSGIFIPDY